MATAPSEADRRQQARVAAAAGAAAAAGYVAAQRPGVPLPPLPIVPAIDAVRSAATITATFVAFLGETLARDDAFLRAELQARSRNDADVRRAIAEEEGRGAEYVRKAQERLIGDLPLALAIPDNRDRERAVAGILRREQRFASQRSEAMLARAVALVDRLELRRASPSGAYWKSDPTVIEHTAGCLVMSGGGRGRGRFWPWAVLNRVHPPRHAGCPCRLHSYGEAIARGWLKPGDVMDVADAVRAARDIVMEAADADREVAAAELPQLREALLAAGLTTPDAIDALVEGYNPAQPRDPGGEGGGQWVRGAGSTARLALKAAGKDITKPQAVAGAKRVVEAVAHEYGHTGALPSIEIRERVDAEPGFLAGVRSGSIVVTTDWLDEAKSRDYGVAPFRQIAHEAVHVVVSGEPRVKGSNSRMIEEGAAEVLSIAMWHRRGQSYDERDAVRRGGRWDHSLASTGVYKNEVGELIRRAASRVGWEPRAVLAEVERVMRGDHNARLDFRDTSDPATATPPGYDDDGEDLLRWLLGEPGRG